MTARRLIYWDRFHRRRSGAARRALIGAALAAGLATAATAFGGEGARRMWVQAAFVLAAIVASLGPWRLFWRPDAAFLGRLPLSGGALYALSLWASLRGAALAGLPLLCAALPFGADAPRFLALGALALAAAALVSPPASCAGGAVIVSHQTQAAVQSLAGGYSAPPVVWLSLFPALGGAGVGVALWQSAPWLAGGEPPLALIGALVGAGALLAAAVPLARQTLAASTREVSALDAVKLAPIERLTARGLERLWGRLFRAGPVYDKDVALMRRRYPILYLGSAVVILGMWIGSAHVEPALVGTLLLGTLVRIHAVFLNRPPTEHPRLLRTFPDVRAGRAKRLHLLYRALVTLALGATPALVRTGSWIIVAVAVATALVASWQTEDLVQLQGKPPARMA